MSIPVTVGRKVWYFAHAENPPDAQPCDATVVYVHNDRLVNLRVTNHHGDSQGITNVPLLQDNDVPLGAHCTWMPYQKGQAAKTEQADGAMLRRIEALEANLSELRYPSDKPSEDESISEVPARETGNKRKK